MQFSFANNSQSASGASPKREALRFLGVLYLVTTITWIAIPALSQANGSPDKGMLRAIFFLGSGVHVSSTFGIFLDPGAHPLIRSQRSRMITVPLLVMSISAVVWVLASTRTQLLLLLGYFIWQTHHYTKQNIGVLSFSCRAVGSKSPTKLERQILLLSGIAAIFSMIDKVLPIDQLPFNYLLRFASNIGVALYSVVVVTLFILIITDLKQYCSLRGIFVAFGVIFYLPLFIYESPTIAVATYAIAHGLQYLVFMFYIGQGIKDDNRRLIRLLMVLLAAMGGLSLWVLSHRPVPDLLFGAYLGFVTSHFIVDAGVWRLSKKIPREYISSRFWFLA